MSPSPFISAIVPCFNVGSLLERTIDSLLAQTLPPREILVIDDASTSAETLSALEAVQSIPSVTVLRQPANQGVAAARNRGLDTCRGDFAVFLDADDLFTAPSLAAFHDALANAPDASFAYPTVTCFGNRNDTFPAPEFNAYLLHHANICPIASMITRGAIDSGVRFDTAISVGHEDWDYWLRLVDAGHLGRAAPDAVLLYRRVGFTRNDLGNQMEGGFEGLLRTLRPSIFESARLMTLKRRWAPGMTVVTTDPDRVEREVSAQTCRDVEVLEPAEVESARGRIVAFEWRDSGGYLTADEFAVEDTLALGHFIAAHQVIVSLSAESIRAGTPSGIPQASDTRRGWVTSQDITAIALPNGWAKSIAMTGMHEIRAIMVNLLQRTGVVDDRYVLWRAPQTGAALRQRGSGVEGGATTQSGRLKHEDGWTREVLAGLPLGAPWAVATASAQGLFGSPGPTSFRESMWVRDPFGGQSLYGVDEELLVGSQTTGHGPPALRTSAQGTVPLKRIESNLTHERAMTTGAVQEGWMLQEVVGHIEANPVPGSRPLVGIDAVSGAHAAPIGRVFSTSRDGGMTWPRSSDLLFEARVMWRAARDDGPGYRYAVTAAQLSGEGLALEGRAFVVFTTSGMADDMVPVFPWFATDGHICGFTTPMSEPEPPSPRGAPVGYLYARQGPDTYPVTAAQILDDGSRACSTKIPEGPGAQAPTAAIMGYSVRC